MKYANFPEEQLKNTVAHDFFPLYDTTRIIGNIDFCVAKRLSTSDEDREDYSLLWAEAKAGTADLRHALAQLILTIGKARTFDKVLPPAFLGAFNAQEITFVPYADVHEIFYINDFNWNVAPSDHSTPQFQRILDLIANSSEQHSLTFDYIQDERALIRFVRDNFAVSTLGVTQIPIDKNNFLVVYNRWCQMVKPSILVGWERLKDGGILDGDFYLADLLAQDNVTLRDKLNVLLQRNHYELNRHVDAMGLFTSSSAQFSDNQAAHTQFWTRYKRPPEQEYWDHLVKRRDLLVPQDTRERKGSFFTPMQWVELSQRYLAKTLGPDWQEEYYIWDCAAGTGNLLAGLTNKYNIFASTIDQQDVDVMRDRVAQGANLVDAHIFQFDFLNDPFSKLPEPLRHIIEDPEKRKKLVIYINPPYVEASNARTPSGTGENRTKVTTKHSTGIRYKEQLGKASNELYAHFFMRIYMEIPSCILAHFSTLKMLKGVNFSVFRETFAAELRRLFIVPANTFDNVSGQFPIGFFIWDTDSKKSRHRIQADIYERDGSPQGKKLILLRGNHRTIGQWVLQFNLFKENPIGYLDTAGYDFQNNRFVHIASTLGMRHITYFYIAPGNLIPASVYLAVRLAIAATWLNDRDQFYAPKDSWMDDRDFQSDCLAYALFSGQNRITCTQGVNHWIPFTEEAISAKQKFESRFMVDFMAGRLAPKKHEAPLLGGQGLSLIPTTPIAFSPTAQDLFAAGRRLWTYYHEQPNALANASFYDIREHFQGRNAAGRMNPNSEDATYNELIAELRTIHNDLATRIEPRIYEHGFLI